MNEFRMIDECLYEPAEDTFLLARATQRHSGKVILEIGVGSGYISVELSKNSFTVGTDISINAIRKAKIKLKSINCNNVELVHCDGASPFRKSCFDMIVFNPPYLPSEKIIDLTVDGGQEGIEVVKKFIEDSVNVLSNSGSIIFLLSNISNYKKIFKILREKGFEVRIKESLKLFYEEIFILKASKIH